MWLSQALNAILLPVLLVLMLRLANDRHLIGEHRNGRVVNVLAWRMNGLILQITVVLFTVSLAKNWEGKYDRLVSHGKNRRSGCPGDQL